MNAADLPNEALFEGALNCRTPAERAAYLDQACAGQPYNLGSRRQVQHRFPVQKRERGDTGGKCQVFERVIAFIGSCDVVHSRPGKIKHDQRANPDCRQEAYIIPSHIDDSI